MSSDDLDDDCMAPRVARDTLALCWVPLLVFGLGCDGEPQAESKGEGATAEILAVDAGDPPPVEQMAAAREAEPTMVCPADADADTDTDTDMSFPTYDQRRLLSRVPRGLPGHVARNAKATVIAMGRDAVYDCTDTHCSIRVTGTYEKHAAIEGKCSLEARTVCSNEPFANEKILRSKKEWPVHVCSGVFVSKGVVATGSHCLNLTLAATEGLSTPVDASSDFALFKAVSKGKNGQKFRVTNYDEVVFIAGVDDWSEPIPRERIAEASLTLYMEKWTIVHQRELELEDVADVALIQVRPFTPSGSEKPTPGDAFPGLEPVTLGSAPVDGSPLYVLGHPVGLPLTVSGCAKATVEDGRLSFELDADVLHGSSGSPVFDADGALVGLIQDDGTPWNEQDTCCDLTGFEGNRARASRFEAAAGFIRRFEQQRKQTP